VQYLMFRIHGITCRWRMQPATRGVRSFTGFFSCGQWRDVGAVANPLLSLITTSTGMVGSVRGGWRAAAA
jgi:hypothetical protein